MNIDFLDNRGAHYITHVILHGERIIPSDSFEIDGNEYVLLEILKSTDGIIFLKIIGIKGENFGNIYLIPRYVFEKSTAQELKEQLQYYQH